MKLYCMNQVTLKFTRERESKRERERENHTRSLIEALPKGRNLSRLAKLNFSPLLWVALVSKKINVQHTH